MNNDFKIDMNTGEVVERKEKNNSLSISSDNNEENNTRLFESPNSFVGETRELPDVVEKNIQLTGCPAIKKENIQYFIDDQKNIEYSKMEMLRGYKLLNNIFGNIIDIDLSSLEAVVIDRNNEIKFMKGIYEKNKIKIIKFYKILNNFNEKFLILKDCYNKIGDYINTTDCLSREEINNLNRLIINSNSLSRSLVCFGGIAEKTMSELDGSLGIIKKVIDGIYNEPEEKQVFPDDGETRYINNTWVTKL